MNNSITWVSRILATLILFSLASCGGGKSQQAKPGLASEEEKYLGNIISNDIPEDYTQYWNQVTIETKSHWFAVEAKQHQFEWATVDAFYQYAMDNDVIFNQHSLVSGSLQPAWVANLFAAEQRAKVEEIIKTFCERYPRTHLFGAASMPVNSPPRYAEALGGEGDTGWDWLVWVYEKARLHCPMQALILSEFNLISDEEVRAQFLNAVAVLKSRNLIDGIGPEGSDLTKQGVTAEGMQAFLDELAQTDLPIYFTRFYITKDDLQVQKEKYAELFPVVWEHPGVKGVTLWGYEYGKTFEESDLLLEDQVPSPAMQWLMDYFAARK